MWTCGRGLLQRSRWFAAGMQALLGVTRPAGVWPPHTSSSRPAPPRRQTALAACRWRRWLTRTSGARCSAAWRGWCARWRPRHAAWAPPWQQAPRWRWRARPLPRTPQASRRRCARWAPGAGLINEWVHDTQLGLVVPPPTRPSRPPLPTQASAHLRSSSSGPRTAASAAATAVRTALLGVRNTLDREHTLERRLNR